MGIEFGGARARETGTFKSLAWSLQYVNKEPALVIWRLAAVNSTLALKNSAACVICLSRAHAYRSDNGKHLRENFGNFIRAARAIGMDTTTRASLKEFIDCCEHKLAELTHMKPDPTLFEKPKNVETTVTDGTKAVMVVH